MQQDRDRLITDGHLTAALEQRKAIVVHFSHHANMRPKGVFPNDLQGAINKKDKWPLSCSVLWPGHTMRPCGSVGVMFRPTVASVLSVSNTDAGAFAGTDGVDHSGGQPLNADTLDETFQVAGEYNEWRVRGADVIGIFVLNIYCVEVKKAMLIPSPHARGRSRVICATRIALSEVFEAFGALPVFTMSTSGLVCLRQL